MNKECKCFNRSVNITFLKIEPNQDFWGRIVFDANSCNGTWLPDLITMVVFSNFEYYLFIDFESCTTRLLTSKECLDHFLTLVDIGRNSGENYACVYVQLRDKDMADKKQAEFIANGFGEKQYELQPERRG